tara:strand:- start:14697 stop:15851 length:1155 start_codon:yes stop_codon:yes gene_type:complete
MPSPYSVKTITNIEQAKLLENEWRILTEKNAEIKTDLQCFMSWEWLSQWLETYQDYILNLKIICVLYHDEVVAIAPFYISATNTWGVTQKALSFIATNEPEQCEVASEFIDIAYSILHKEKISELLSEQLIKLNNITKFSFKDLNKNALMYMVCQKIKAKMITYEEEVVGYQFINDINNPPQYSVSFLKKKKRILNKFEKIGNSKYCQFVIAKDAIQALKLYEKLVELHLQRWQQRNKPGVFSNNYFYEFHRNFIINCFKKGMIVLSAIQIENKIISVNYSIKWHNTLFFYQSGIDELHKPNVSPGLLNHLLLINYCEKQKIECYNLLKSSKIHDYKGQFSQVSDELINITMLLSNKFNFLSLIFYRAKCGLKQLLKLLRQKNI